MFPLIQFFIDSLVQDVPDQLLIRPNPQSTFLLGLGFIGLMFVGLSRMSNLKSVSTVVRVFFNSESIEQAQKEHMRLSSLSFIFLIINYAIACGIMIWMGFNALGIKKTNGVWLLAFALPVFLILYEVIVVSSVGLITGEQKRIIPTISLSLIGYAFSGMVILLGVFLWILNPALNKILLYAFLFLVLLFYLIRVVKNSSAVLKNGVPWYYLILYFCTLEILPILVGFYFLVRNFYK